MLARMMLRASAGWSAASHAHSTTAGDTLRNATIGLFSLLALSAITMACDSDNDAAITESAPLPTAEAACEGAGFTWLEDQGGYYPPDPSGAPNGPLLTECIETCQTDADCIDSGRPFCAVHGLSNGGDYNCNGQIDVCRATDRDDCD
ncbi:MAG: hypothetical protein ACI9MR_000214 [Myxococcota bacterium]|jgi:hypothetical protein